MDSKALDRTRAIAFLRRDVFRNVVMLKTLTLYPDNVQTFYCEQGQEKGVLLLLETTASSFDHRSYPQTKYVVLAALTQPNMLDALIPHIPTNTNLVFKLTNSALGAILQKTFPFIRTSAYISYTNTRHRTFTPHHDVIVSTNPTEDSYNLFEIQGHPRAEVESHFANGEALCFSLSQETESIAACFTFQNFEQIHEIGGVYTIPAERLKGHARKLVTTALYELMQRDRIPRYAVHESNNASIQLAESLGLESLVTMEHWLYLKN
jgi:predicted GNAT family acetyltransferase